ncbi:tetratricopeptide repeat protein [Nioella sp.]|uniref:tetratricopeptide repeat protein n=1 Tax=Nioella sp. TaxID=1912091 RepID=UPI003A892CE2
MELFNKGGGHGRTLFVFPAIGGPAKYARLLDEAIGGTFDLVQLDRARASGHFLCNPEDIRRLHMEQIRATCPSGPYFLIGYSFGAQAAYYTAVALQEAAEEVAFLGIIDDDADVHRRRFNINAVSCADDDAVAAGRHALDLNLLYHFSGKITLFKADLWSGARKPGPACDWDFLADGGVDVFTYPFTHTSIVSATGVNAWLPQLRIALDRAAGNRVDYPEGTGPDFHPSRVKDIPQEAFDAFRASKAGDLAAEIEGYETALSKAPEAADWVSINLAAALRQNGQADKAVAILKTVCAAAAVPGNAHFELISLLNATGSHAERNRLATELVSMSSITASDYHFKGILLEACQRPSDSVTAFRKAIELSPDRSDSRYRCAQVMLREGRFAEARDIVDQGLERDPRSGFLWTILGEIQVSSGCVEEAEATLRHVLETEPSQVRAVMILAQLLIDAGRLSEAHVLLEERLSRNSGHHGLWLVNADIQLLLGKRAEAESAYRRALAIQNQDIRAWRGLAKLLADSSQCESALDLLRGAPLPVQQNGAVRMLAGDIALSCRGV